MYLFFSLHQNGIAGVCIDLKITGKIFVVESFNLLFSLNHRNKHPPPQSLSSDVSWLT